MHARSQVILAGVYRRSANCYFMPITTPQAHLYQLASNHLSRIDEDWARLVSLVGPCTHQPKPVREPYEALIRAVAYQQLHAKAGDAIIARLQGMYPECLFPTPDQLLATDFDAFRACGFSGRKIDTIKSIAEHTVSRVVPSREVADGMADDELIIQLVKLRGIGRWTVEMVLIYTLGRMDIMPADDFGIRQGYRSLKSLDAVPSRKEIDKAGLVCSPYRTVASWYLWRIPR
jgi:DNA-3-methyladenine glycosylase II